MFSSGRPAAAAPKCGRALRQVGESRPRRMSRGLRMRMWMRIWPAVGKTCCLFVYFCLPNTKPCPGRRRLFIFGPKSNPISHPIAEEGSLRPRARSSGQIQWAGWRPAESSFFAPNLSPGRHFIGLLRPPAPPLSMRHRPPHFRCQIQQVALPGPGRGRADLNIVSPAREIINSTGGRRRCWAGRMMDFWRREN